MALIRRTFFRTTPALARSFSFHVSQEQQSIRSILEANKQEKIIGASSRDSLEGITKLLQQYKVGALPVFDCAHSGLLEKTKTLQIEGIISERDVVREIALSNIPLKEIPVATAMTPKSKLIVVSESTSAGDAIELMLQKNIRHLVVLEKKGWTFTGLVSIKDVLHGLFYADQASTKSQEAFQARAVGLAASW